MVQWMMSITMAMTTTSTMEMMMMKKMMTLNQAGSLAADAASIYLLLYTGYYTNEIETDSRHK